MNLRPYQLASLETSKKKFESGVTRQLIALPTGTGKTVVFASVREFFGFQRRVLVLVHREELAQQAAEKIAKWNPGCTVGVEMGDLWAKPTDTFVVASVQTLGRAGSSRLARFVPDEFDCIICDEAHHSTAPSYQTVFSHFGVTLPLSRKLLLGVTATPNRGDGAALGQVYDEIVYQMTILDAIKQGWLVDLRGVRVNTNVRLDDVKTRAGDFVTEQLSSAVNTPARNDLIVREWMKHAHDRQTIAFTTDIAHAQSLAEAFKRYGVPAEAVWGDDPHRADKLRFHRSKGLRVLCNCAVLTEGYDDPGIGCIIMARPTKSNLLFVQMAGRGTRIPEGVTNLNEAKSAGQVLTKQDCLLMDVVDNTTRHSLITLTSIFGLGNKLDLKGGSATRAVKAFEEAQASNPNADLSQVTSLEQLSAVVEQVNLFEVKFPQPVIDNSLLQWHAATDGQSFVLLLPGKESVVITEDLLGKWAVTGTVKGNKFTEKSDSLPEAFRTADNMVSTFGSDLVHLLRRQAKWHEDRATDKQLALLRRLRIPVPPNITKGQAAHKLNEFFARKHKGVAVA